MKLFNITPNFVEFIPKKLDEGALYIATEHSTATHLCCCGCGTKVVLSLRPTDHSLDVSSQGYVSIWPSVGNWDLPCRSHYIIKQNRVIWVGAMRDEDIKRAYLEDEAMKEAYISGFRRKKAWWQKVFDFIKSIFG